MGFTSVVWSNCNFPECNSSNSFLLQPKYIQNLLRKAEERQREQEIVYERKLAKERSQEDHIYADKDKFVTSAYKKKLAEQAKWMEEERLRQLREEKDDVCINSSRKCCPNFPFIVALLLYMKKKWFEHPYDECMKLSDNIDKLDLDAVGVGMSILGHTFP